MSSFFKPARGTRRKVAGASLVLGLSPLLALTPVAAQQTAPQEKPAQNAPVQNEPAQGNQQDASLPTLRVSSGSLDILHGGTVHVDGTGLSPEFLAHHELRSLTVAPKGSSTYANPYQKLDHRGLVFDAPKPAADGSFSADLTVPANSLPANLEYEVILTYRPVDDAHPYAWNTEDRVRTALPVEFNLPKAQLPSITYDVSAISEEQIASGQPIEVTLTGTGFQDVSSVNSPCPSMMSRERSRTLMWLRLVN